MSDREAQDGQNTRLLRALLWAGVGLAPAAALLVLVGGDGGPTRFGVLLLAVAVVLVGAALLIRSDPVLLGMDVEDRVADEVAALRTELRGEIAAAVEEANRAVSRAEQIRKFRILPGDFTEEAGELTPTMKIKRKVVAQMYAREIDSMYSEDN